MIDPLLSLALGTGLFGSGHCLGMCGGLVAALSLGGPRRRGLGFHLLYNAGRIATYTAIGAVVGGLGSALAFSQAFKGFTRIILLGSDLFIVLVGLGSTGVLHGLSLARLEFGGFGPRLSRMVQGLLQTNSVLVALPLGLLLGFLPCGFVYAMALTAAQTMTVGKGAGVMLAFGLGTVPALFLFGGTAHWLSQRARRWMLVGAGSLVAGMGLLNLYRHLRLLGFWS